MPIEFNIKIEQVESEIKVTVSAPPSGATQPEIVSATMLKDLIAEWQRTLQKAPKKFSKSYGGRN